MTSASHHLVGIAFSHFVEKARWVLDRYDQRYTESRLLPMFHMPVAAWASRGQGLSDRASSRYSTPILITDRGERICDSAEIVRYASDRWGDGELYRDAKAAEIETHFHDGLARDTRKMAYGLLLGDATATGAMLENVGPMQRALFRGLAPVAERALVRALRISDAGVERALERTRTTLADVSEQLSDGRPYLLGDAFSAADLAFACAIAPALVVQQDEGYSSRMPTAAELPVSARAVREELRTYPASRFALRLFRDERG